jgi:hypothetical protein
MMFSSLADDGTTSDLVIRPDFYITSRVRTCVVDPVTVGVDARCSILHVESSQMHLLLYDCTEPCHSRRQLFLSIYFRSLIIGM